MTLEARLLEPGLCHSFPGKPTSLAYDSEGKHIAVGCDNGKVAVLFQAGKKVKIVCCPGHDGKSVGLMSFFHTGKPSQVYLVITLKHHPELFLWTLADESDQPKFQPSTPMPDSITALTWSPTHSVILVGTKVGEVYALTIEPKNGSRPILVTKPRTYHSPEIFRDSKSGEVTSIQEKPPTGDKPSYTVVVFSGGLTVLLKGSTHEFTDKISFTNKVPVNAWWHRSMYSYTVVFSDGSIIACRINFDAKSAKIEKKYSRRIKGTPSDDVSLVTKCERIVFERSDDTVLWFLYAGGCSSAPEGVDPSHIISVYSAKEDTSQCFMPFGSRVVDFMGLPKFLDPSILLVLTESEFLRINLKDSNAKDIENLARVPTSPYAQITSPVTSLQYGGMCSHEIIEIFKDMELEFETSVSNNQLIVTGHKDGSARLWVCNERTNSSLRTRIGLVVHTANYFDFHPKEKQPTAHLQDSLEVSSVKLVDKQQFLLVANKFGCILLFKFKKQSARNQQEKMAQSQEVILKEEMSDAMPPSKTPLLTPAPHLCQYSWQLHTELLQHFICYYQSQCDKPLEPEDIVQVNCMDYNDQKRLLVVGTAKGLMVLDTSTNQLIQVIGSEKKLLEISGRADKKRTTPQKKPSESECNVTCLEACVAEPTPQLTLWVGTAGGALGVFTVTRNKAGEPLQLGETGKGRKKDSAIVRIQHQRIVQLNQKKRGQLQFDKADTPRNDSAKSADELQNLQDYMNQVGDPVHGIAATSTTYAVVTTEKQVKCYHHFLKKNDSLRNGIDLTNSLKTGILMINGHDDSPYLVCLLNNGKFDVYSLSDGGKVLDGVSLLDDDTVADLNSKVLFSADKNYVVLQNHAKELKLIELKHQRAEEQQNG